ncbi:flagellar protein FlgJ [Methylomagnum ishizawai]|uniref:Peptidoglycan hydrolase FlgJ n=1 Tax=Methylomagnum ishizawai TaxID=1760988 RepID=A0A1Y6D608_9GAMM|nr:flagellar assembly peptidoglycan hydrolase FlgJ [Methylomagnum ishizawai]SMF95804.1 flagellar protein FlgJ [Methylomagnum ishizawai]
MIKSSGLADVYTDFKGTAALRTQAKQDPKAALKETAQQFESLFVQMALKSMRQATLKSGLTDSPQSETFQEMHDQQLAVELGKHSKLGIANMLERQLGGGAAPSSGLNGKSLDDYRQTPYYRPRGMAAGVQHTGTRAPVDMPTANPGSGEFDHRDQFVAAVWPHAQKAAAEIGVDPKLLVAQAALETGWGKSRNGNNLFGIKADRHWQGAKLTAGTTEFVGGAQVREQAAFRAYGSPADSFRDYVGFLKSNPRYQAALQHAENPRQFIAGLQKAGYATDPAYARKVMAIYQDGNAFDQVPEIF